MFSALVIAANAGDDSSIIHDGHIHYDQDVWDTLPPADAIKMLKHENISSR
jgi:hypothetical protein